MAMTGALNNDRSAHHLLDVLERVNREISGSATCVVGGASA